MRNLKVWLPILFCFIAGCSRTVDVSPPISKDPSNATLPTDATLPTEAPSADSPAAPGESPDFDDHGAKN